MNIDNYLITPLFLLLIIGGVINLTTFFFLLKLRKSAGVKYWLAWQIATSIWAFTYALEYGATDIETKIFWSKFSYFGIVYSTVSFLFFSLDYSSQARFLNKKIVTALYAIASILILSPFTNGSHHLHWISYSINSSTNTTSYVYGPFFWIIFTFLYANLTIGIINIVVFFFRLSGFYRKQIVLVFIASLFPLAGNLIYVFQINPIPGFDWTPFSFLITGILIAINISHFKLFDLVPFARNKLFDILPDGILITDQSMRIADFNPAMQNLMNNKLTNIIGSNVSEVFPHRLELIQEIISKEDFETVITHESGANISHFEFKCIALRDQSNQVNGRLILLNDITAQVMAEKEIKDTNSVLTKEIQEKEKLIDDLDAFSHTVAHDLKNMLGAIVSASEFIHTDFDSLPKETILEIVDLIYNSANKTLHVTTELLTLATVRQQEIKMVGIDMQNVVLDSVSRLKAMIQSNEASVGFPDEWPVVFGYGAWLEEVWVNYISNGIKYGGTPALLQIGAEILPGNRVKYWIKDNGKGLSSVEIAQLFSKFTRLDPIRAEGHGLGLSIVKRIIEKLNGEVGVESANIPGEGSLFYFILPLAG